MGNRYVLWWVYIVMSHLVLQLCSSDKYIIFNLVMCNKLSACTAHYVQDCNNQGRCLLENEFYEHLKDSLRCFFFSQWSVYHSIYQNE